MSKLRSEKLSANKPDSNIALLSKLQVNITNKISLFKF